MLNCKLSTVYAWAKAGEVPARKINGLVRFDPVEIDEWLERARLQPAAAKETTDGIRRPISKSDIDRIIRKSIDDARQLIGARGTGRLTGQGDNAIIPSKGKPDESSPERR